MHFEIKVDKFKNEVNLLQGIAEKKSGVAALSSLLIETTKKGIRMTGTDLDTTVRVEVGADVKEEGSICLPAKTLCDFVKALDNGGTVTFKDEPNNWAKLTCGKSKRRFAGIGKDQFPEISNIESDEVIVEGALLKNLIQHTCFAITQEESRYVLSGAKLEVLDGNITMVATDGHRVAVMTESIDDIEATLDVLVPKKALTEVSKFAGNEIVITDNNNHIKFESGNRLLICRKIVGNFPNYRMALPKDNSIEVAFSGTELIKCLKRVSQASDENSKAIKFEIQKNEILLSAAAANQGESADALKCETKELPEEGVIIYLNWQYLTDFLATCNAPTLKIKDGLSAVEVIDGAANYVLMPLRAN